MSRENIVVIDYGLCNLLSVSNALRHLGKDCLVTDDPSALRSADAVILPGVGAFEDGMKGLRNKNFIDPIHAFVGSGKPFLGICLGMQMLMTKSYEFGIHEGLNLIDGDVIPFKNKMEEDAYNFKVPHIGWNHLLKGHNTWDATILSDLDEGELMYFVHSYFALPAKEENCLAKTEYGGVSFCSVNQRDNVYGCQFHPEKSSTWGLKILENFVRLIK